MTIRLNHPDTMNHPKMRDFLAACQSVRPGTTLHSDDIASDELIVFSESLLIMLWDKTREDFMYRMCGSTIVDLYGQDCTGSYTSEALPNEAGDQFRAAHLDLMRHEKLLFIDGIIDWNDRVPRPWNQVSMPLRRKGEITGTLTYAQIDEPINGVRSVAAPQGQMRH